MACLNQRKVVMFFDLLDEFALLLVGFALLAWSADRFIDGAAAAARRLGMPPLLIGLTIVGFGTSAPEMLVSANAALEGSPGIAIGNALGSNIANIALIVGVTALLAPLVIGTGILRQEIPLLFAAMALTFVVLWDGVITRWEGFLLLAGLVATLGFLSWRALHTSKRDKLSKEFAAEIPADMPMKRALLWLAVGLGLLLLSSRILVDSAISIATAFGVSELVIGLTVIAIGTSLPELAASLVSSRKGEDDIAVGNIIGSNMFNLLGVIGLAAALEPTRVEPGVLARDFTIMTALTVGLIVLGHGLGKRGHLGRWSGGLLLSSYAAYGVFIYMTAV